MWPDRRLLDLFGIEIPIVQAPMAGATDCDLAAAVSEAGGLGSLPCATLEPDKIREQVAHIRSRTGKPINLNFFCHVQPALNNAREAEWREHLEPYYRELGVDPSAPAPSMNRAPFGEAAREVILELKPAVVSFHYGLPAAADVTSLKEAGCCIISTATTVAEARWLAERGADAIIAQGYEAGGHRGMFLSDDLATQVGTLSLVPQIVDAVDVPVIAAGGIADGRGIAAALALGAAGAQLGTAYLRCPESKISAPFRSALEAAQDDGTVVANVFTGRPARTIVNRLAREVGPISPLAPAFPLAAGAIAPLRAKAEAQGSGDFSPLLAGQAASLARAIPAGDLTRMLANETFADLKRLEAPR